MRFILKILIPFLIVAGGVAVAVVLVKTRPQAARVAPQDRAILVEITTVTSKAAPVEVRAMGTVIPSREMVLMPEVSGRVVEQHPRFVPGGLVSEGELLVQLDGRDYELQVSQQRAAVANAKFALEVERGQQKVASREWELLDELGVTGKKGGKLALRKPHLKNAKAQLSGARGGLGRAQLAVERTQIKAPFNGLVVREQTEVGQLVGPQFALGTLAGTDSFWVRIALAQERLAMFTLPGPDGAGGATCSVTVSREGEPQAGTHRSCRVVRLLGDVDPLGRMARVLVEVSDPMALASTDEEMPAVSPLLLGSYVEVTIQGHTLEQVFEIPRKALRNADRVWVMNSQNTLEFREVTLAWRESETVLVKTGLSDGDRVVLSAIGTPVPGMSLRTTDRADATDGAGADKPATASDGGE